LGSDWAIIALDPRADRIPWSFEKTVLGFRISVIHIWYVLTAGESMPQLLISLRQLSRHRLFTATYLYAAPVQL